MALVSRYIIPVQWQQHGSPGGLFSAASLRHLTTTGRPTLQRLSTIGVRRPASPKTSESSRLSGSITTPTSRSRSSSPTGRWPTSSSTRTTATPRVRPTRWTSYSVFTAETRGFFWAGAVAIDTTEADPFTGDRTGHEEEIIGTKEETDEYAYQWRRSSSSVEQNGLSKPSCSRIFLTDSLENTYLNPVICRVVATSSRCDGVGVVGAAKRIAGHEDRGRAIAAGTPRVRSVGEIVVRYAIAGHTPAVGDTGRPGGHEAILFRLSQRHHR